MDLFSDTHYKKHLYFEGNPNSREFQLDKCIKVLAMIARLKDRNTNIINTCEFIYGKHENGRVRVTERDLLRFNRNLEMIERLKGYFNYCLSKVNKFKQ